MEVYDGPLRCDGFGTVRGISTTYKYVDGKRLVDTQERLERTCEGCENCSPPSQTSE